MSDNEYAHGLFLVTATSTVGTPSGDPAESTLQALPDVYSIDLNRPQNMGCYAQGQSTADDAVTCPPLGTVVEGGLPAKPLSWFVRERLGTTLNESISTSVLAAMPTESMRLRCP